MTSSSHSVTVTAPAPGPQPAPGASPASMRARQACCGVCWAEPGDPCGDARGDLARLHLGRFARARRRGLVTGSEMAATIEAAGDVFTSATIIPYAGPLLRVRCSCGWTWAGPEHAWEWIEDRHCHAHQKDTGGLQATCRITIQRDGAP